MGYELRRMIRDGAPPTWTSGMRVVACEIADQANPEPSRALLGEGDYPLCTRPVEDWQDKRGDWHEGLATLCGMSARAFSDNLTKLAEQGYEMRVQIGTDKRGRPVFAHKGRGIAFMVRPLKPRDAQSTHCGAAL